MSVGITSFATPPVLLPINLVLIAAATSPTLQYNFGTLPISGDVIQWFDGASLLGSHTFTQTDIDNGSLGASLAPLAAGFHSISVTQTRGSLSVTSNAVSFTV